MIDVHLSATGGRQFILPRYTRPDKELQLLLLQLGLILPEQPCPRIQIVLLPNKEHRVKYKTHNGVKFRAGILPSYFTNPAQKSFFEFHRLTQMCRWVL